MIYCEYKLKHSFNVIYEEKEHEPKFGFLLSAMEDPFSHTALSGMSVNFEKTRLRIDNGTFASGGYIVQTFHPLYMCSPDFSGVTQVHIPVPDQSNNIGLVPGMETPPGVETEEDETEEDGTTPVTGHHSYTFDMYPGFSTRIAPSIDNHEFGIVKKFTLDYTNMLNVKSQFVIDLTKPIHDDIKFNQRKATFKWEDKNHIIINGFKDYVNNSISSINNIQELSLTFNGNDSDGLLDKYENNSIELTVINDAIINVVMSQDGTLIIMDETSNKSQIKLHYIPDENNDAIMFFEELFAIDKQGLYPLPMYTYNVHGVNKMLQLKPTLDPVATISSSDYPDYTVGFNWHDIQFNEEITVKISDEVVLDHIADKYYWLEMWTESPIHAQSIEDINIEDVSNMGSYVDEHVNGYSLTYDAGKHWLYINNINGFTIRFPEYDPVVTTPIPKELINSLHDGIIYTDYEKFEFTTEYNPNNDIDVIDSEKQLYLITIVTVANNTKYSMKFYSKWDTDQSFFYDIEYTSESDATITDVYIGLISDFQNKVNSSDAVATLVNNKMKIESAKSGEYTINITSELNINTTILNIGADEVEPNNDTGISDISSLWSGSTEELQSLIGDINDKLEEEDSTAYSNTITEADTNSITQTLLNNWENSQLEGAKYKVLVTFQYYHDLNIIKFQIKDSYDLTRNDCILATLITEDTKSYYITYRDYEYPRMIPYAEWNEFDSYTYASKFLPSLGNNTIPIDNTLIVPEGTGGINNTDNSNLQGSPTIFKITIPNDNIIGVFSFTINAMIASEVYNVSYSATSSDDVVSIINGLYSSIVSHVNAINVVSNKTDTYIFIASTINGENTIVINDIKNVTAELVSTGINNPNSYTNVVNGTPKTFSFSFNPAASNAVYSFDVIKNEFNVTVSYLTPDIITQEELFDNLIIDFESKVAESIATIEKVDLGDGTFSLKIIATDLGTAALYIENVDAVVTNPNPGDHTTYRIDIDHVANTNSYTFDYEFNDVLSNPKVNVKNNIYYESNNNASLSDIKSALISNINSNNSNFLNAMDPDSNYSSIIVTSAVQGESSIKLLNFNTQQLDNSITTTNTIISIIPEIIQENAIYSVIIKDHATGNEISIEYVGLVDDTAETIIEHIYNQIQSKNVDDLYKVTLPPINGVSAELNYISNDQIISEPYTGHFMSPILNEDGILMYSNTSETIDTDYVSFYDINSNASSAHLLAPTPLLMGRYGYSVDFNDKYYAISDPLDDKGKVYIYNKLDNSLINILDGSTYSSLGWFGRKVTLIDELIIVSESHSTGNHKVFFINIIDGIVINEISKSYDSHFGGVGIAYNTQNVFLSGESCVYMYDLDGGNEIKITAHDSDIVDYSKKIQANDKYIILSGEIDAIHIYDVTGMDTIEYKLTLDKQKIDSQLSSPISGAFGKHIAMFNDLLLFSNETQVFAYNIHDDTIFTTGLYFARITGLAVNSIGFIITETNDGSESEYGVHYLTYEYIAAIPPGDNKTIFIESNTGGYMTFGAYNVSELIINIEDQGSDLPQAGIITPILLKKGSFDTDVIANSTNGNIDPGTLENVWVNINDIVITNNGSPSGSGQCSDNVVSVSMIVRLKYNSKFIGEYAGVLSPGSDLQYWGAVITDILDDSEYIFEVTVTTELGNSAVAVDESVIIDVDGIPNVLPEPETFVCNVSDYDVVSSTLTQYSQAVGLGKMLIYDFDKMLTIHDMSIENSNEITTDCSQAKSFLNIPLNQSATFHFTTPSDCTRMMIVPVLFGTSNDYDYSITVNDMDIMDEFEFDHSMIYNATSIHVKITSRCIKMLLSGMVLLYDSKSISPTNNLRINHQNTRSAPMVDYIVIDGWEGLTTTNLIEADFVELEASWNLVDPNSDDITIGIYHDNKYLISESYEKNVNNMKINLSKSLIMENAAIYLKDNEKYLQVPITFRISNVNGTREVNKYILIKDYTDGEIKPTFSDMNKIISWEDSATERKEYVFVPIVQYLDKIQYSIWFYAQKSDTTPVAMFNNDSPATIIRHVYEFKNLPNVAKFEVYDVDGNLSDTILETII